MATIMRRAIGYFIGAVAVIASVSLISSVATAAPITPNNPPPVTESSPTGPPATNGGGAGEELKAPIEVRNGQDPGARIAEEQEDLCADEIADRFNSCESDSTEVDWGSGPVVPTKWHADWSVKLRSQYNSGNVVLTLEAKNGTYTGVDAPENGWIKFEFFLKDAGSPTYLPIKTIQPIEIKFQEAANDIAVPVNRTVSPNLVVSLEDKYRLSVKTSAKPDVPGGNYGSAAAASDLGSYVRCDGDVNGVFNYRLGSNNRGCINPDALPIAFHSSAMYPYLPMPKVAENIRTAQANGSPGGTSGLPLHRVIDPQKTANYNASCGNDSRRFAAIGDRPLPTTGVPEWQCDEYPFASSYEGGALAQMMWVPASENSAQGTLLERFFVDNRVLVNDEFLAYGPI